jgi:hypothetical protein
MRLLRFFLTVHQQRRQDVLQHAGASVCPPLDPSPLSRPSSRTWPSLSSTRHGIDRLFLRQLTQPLRPKLPFKSHSAPRPPQTPAASS